MKVRDLFLILLMAAMSATLLVSCDKDEEEEEGDIQAAASTETFSLYTKDFSIWHYFSFETGAIVGTGSADPDDGEDASWKQRTDWDIAFHYYDLRTNSGVSGNANGGMLEASATAFEDVLVAPTSGYTVDDSLEIRLTSAMPPTYINSTASSVCDGWASYDHTEGAWAFAEKVFVVKTANGNYAKIWLKSFLDDEDNSGTITMDYVYLSDGNTSFE